MPLAASSMPAGHELIATLGEAITAVESLFADARRGVADRVTFHGFADEATLAALKAGNQILWQYCSATGELTEAANPNGSVLNIAGICNDRRNVAGLMPHPDRASEEILGSTDGRLIFESMIAALEKKTAAKAA